jgi:thiamine pyrophosphokinase
MDKFSIGQQQSRDIACEYMKDIGAFPLGKVAKESRNNFKVQLASAMGGRHDHFVDRFGQPNNGAAHYEVYMGRRLRAPFQSEGSTSASQNPV